MEDAVEFVNHRGFIFFWPIKDILMPSLWTAAAGDRPVPDVHDDPGHVTWDWKDKLLGKRRCYYARLLRRRNTFVSLDLLPYFYALSPNFGDWENDYLDLYETGHLTLESRLLYEALLREGPLDTIALRKAAHLSAEGSDTRFNRALDDLQIQMRILPVGIAEAGAWRYAFIYDILARHMPDLDSLTRSIEEDTARQRLVSTYLGSVGAAPLLFIARLFGWRPAEALRTVEALVASGVLRRGQSLPGVKAEIISIPDLVE
jgi:hypothetical protein